MAEIEVDDVAAVGSVKDIPSYQLPPGVWTSALNMRCRNAGMESVGGWASTFGSPPAPPHFLIPMRTNTGVFWVWASLGNILVYDGAAHTDISRTVGGAYNTTATEQWNATILGGVLILNNGVDVPQFWANVNVATKMADLTNWAGGGVNVRAKVIRAFGPFLMAFNVTDNSVNYPHMCRWSHPADPGSVPSSWNPADPTKDTGQKDLPDVNSGVIQDAMQLGDIMYVYKETSTWRVKFIGGRFIFDFGLGAWLTTSGILAPRCVCATGDGKKHVVVTQDDIIAHDGQQVTSILNLRQRNALFGDIDTTNYGTSYIFDNPLFGEVVFCYPSVGNTYPNKSLIMNYRERDDWVVTEMDGIIFRNAAVGNIANPSIEQWNDGTDAWDDDTGPWKDYVRRRTIVCDPTNIQFYVLDSGITRNGTPFSSTLRREALAVIGQKSDGSPINDYQAVKLFSNLRPKVQGGPLNIRLGSSEYVNGPIAWGTPVAFDPSSNLLNAKPVQGRALSMELTSPSAAWRIDGYKIDVMNLSEF